MKDKLEQMSLTTNLSFNNLSFFFTRNPIHFNFYLIAHDYVDYVEIVHYSYLLNTLYS